MTVLAILAVISAGLSALFFRKGGVYNPVEKEPLNAPPLEPIQETPVIPSVPVNTPQTPVSGLLWGTKEEIRHSIRVICDQEGLTLEQKNTLCATIQAESGFKLGARLDNKDKNGKVWSTDWGLCQWNSYWHGKEITPEESVHNPEKAVRLMCAYWKRGQRNAWVAYKTGAYKKYL